VRKRLGGTVQAGPFEAHPTVPFATSVVVRMATNAMRSRATSNAPACNKRRTGGIRPRAGTGPSCCRTRAAAASSARATSSGIAGCGHASFAWYAMAAGQLCAVLCCAAVRFKGQRRAERTAGRSPAATRLTPRPRARTRTHSTKENSTQRAVSPNRWHRFLSAVPARPSPGGCCCLSRRTTKKATASARGAVNNTTRA
jgi:hypothetical protein